MTTIYFVRHAEPDYKIHDDITRPLTVKGMADTKLVTEYLKDKEINKVLSSPYHRAICTVKDFTSFTKKQWEDFDYKLSDGESLREVQERNIKALSDVLSLHKGCNIVVGTHGTALSTIKSIRR